jgi:hypothetical protein
LDRFSPFTMVFRSAITVWIICIRRRAGLSRGRRGCAHRN